MPRMKSWVSWDRYRGFICLPKYEKTEMCYCTEKWLLEQVIQQSNEIK